MTRRTGAPQGGMVGTVVTGKVKGKDLTVLGGWSRARCSSRAGCAWARTAASRRRVRAGDVEVEGELEGEMRARPSPCAETARARGTFVAKRLVVKEGARVEGAINPAAA